MKKTLLFLLAAVMAFSFAGCGEDEISCYEEPEIISSSAEIFEEINEENTPEISADNEETKEPETEPSDDFEISSGTSGTTGIEHIEEFILSLEKNEAAFVSGTMMGYTFPYYFELSFEPGGAINLLQVSSNGTEFSGSLSKIYDAETFYYFSGDDGCYFSIPKIKLYTEERFQTEQGEDIEGASVSAKEAEAEAKKVLLLAKGSDSGFYWEKRSACFGSYGHIIVSGNMEKADEYYKNLIPMVTGHAVLEGEHYYMVSMLEGEMDIGLSYAVSAEKPFRVFSISEVDGSFHPLAYDIEPRVDLAISE